MQKNLECYCKKISYNYINYSSCSECGSIYMTPNYENEIIKYSISLINYNKSYYFVSTMYDELVIYNSANIEIIRISGKFPLDRDNIKSSVDKIIDRFLTLEIFY